MNVLTITQLNNLIKRTLDREYLLKNVYVSGTIINAKRHSSGHMYFSLKDEESAIDVTMWSSTVMQKGLANAIQNGLLVTVKASVNFYNKMGSLNLIALDMQIGAKSPLQLEFDALKRELTALGYFDDSHKVGLPYMASCIGIVTSQSGAVLHDILHVSKQRNPLVQFKLFSVPVQGSTAGPIIAKGIATADADPDIDVIIVGRGGGSMEDLWCFNDRAVVEAIYNAHTPIISAVGHETDVTIADFVADLRAPTPSAAAELAVYEIRECKKTMSAYEDRIVRAALSQIGLFRTKAERFSMRLKLLHPRHKLYEHRQFTAEMENRIRDIMERRLTQEKHRLALNAERMKRVSPLLKLSSGYSYIRSEEGKNIRSTAQVKRGEKLEIFVSDGKIEAEVHNTETMIHG